MSIIWSSPIERKVAPLTIGMELLMGEFGNFKSQGSDTHFIFDPLLAATEQYLKPILGSDQ